MAGGFASEEFMPIYEFECSECGADFERLQKLSDSDPEECPNCGKPGVRRRVSAPSFRLAGSGWYETDFKKDGDTRRNLAGSDEPPKPAAKSDAPASAAAPAKTDAPAKADTPAAGTPKANTGKTTPPAPTR
jgi:putative FmdB family regulatory protein